MSCSAKLFLTVIVILCQFTVCPLAAAEPDRGAGGEIPPAVFAVGHEYQILVLAPDTLVRIRIGNEFYSDQINGVRPSKKPVHRFRIPMAVLDRAGKYEVFRRRLPQRLPYLNETKPEPETSRSYVFRKLPDRDIRIYHLSDTHDQVDSPVKTALASGRIDLLVLNGDIADRAVEPGQLELPCVLAGKITNGSIPVIYTRGNHELRGELAEFVQDYTPNRDGKLYYTVRLGAVWALVLDGGEDKVDELPVYGNTIECARHRQEELEYINQTAAVGEFKEPGIKYKLVICHVPFTNLIALSKEDEVMRRRFQIFGDWCKAIRTGIQPDLMLCGHLHQTQVLYGNWYPCPVIVGSRPGREEKFTGASVELKEKEMIVKFTDQNGKTESVTSLPLTHGK